MGVKHMHLLKIFVIVLAISSCLSRSTPDTAASANRQAAAPTPDQTHMCEGISSETAILIVKGKLFLDYDLTDRNASVVEDGDLWKVTLSRVSRKNLQGGNPIVWLRKSNGEVVKVQYAK